MSNIQYKPSIESRITPVHRRGGNATYAEIKTYVKAKYGLCVSSLYIAQTKSKMGIEKRDNYYKGDGKNRVPLCPAEKEKAIMATDIYDPKGLCKDITGLGRWGNGDAELFLDIHRI